MSQLARRVQLTTRSLRYSVAIMALTTGAAFAYPTGEVQTPEEPLAAALKDVARQTGVNIIFQYSAVAGMTAHQMSGTMTARDAVQNLLGGTALEVVTDGNGGLIVRAKRTDGNSLEPAPVAKASSTEITQAETAEVIVTAQKASESIQRVPLSVSTISGDALTESGKTHLADYLMEVPGVNLRTTYGAPGSVDISIRGINSGSQSNTTVATYVDDVPVTASSSNLLAGALGPDPLPQDIDHIEVLKGPQGTLYGASSLGGLVKFVTNTPSLDTPLFRAGVGIFGIDHGTGVGGSIHGTADMPLIQGQLGLGISASQQATPGYIDNIATGTKGYNNGTQNDLRVVALWKPDDRLSVKLTAMYDASDFHGFSQISVNPATLAPTYGDHRISSIEPDGQKTAFNLLYASISYDLGWSSLTSVSSYVKTLNTLDLNDSAFLPAFGIDSEFSLHSNLEKWSQEVRLASRPAERFRWVIGGFYTQEHGHLIDNLLAYNPITQLPSPVFSPLLTLFEPSWYEEKAVFANGTYGLTPNWDVSAGIRYGYNNQRVSEVQTGFFTGPGSSLQNTPSSEGVITYSLSTQYHFAPTASVYGRIATGYQPGGPNTVVPGVGVPTTFQSDSLTNYEVGLKSQWWDKRLTANASIFYIDWNDIQVTEYGPAPARLSYTGNGPKATSQGVEVSSSVIAVKGLKLGFNISYVDAKLSADAPALGGTKGDRLPYTSPLTGTLMADYSAPITRDYRGSVGVLWQYNGALSTAFPANSGYYRLPSYDVVNLHAAILHDQWRVEIYANNVGDSRAVTSYSGIAGAAILQPRTVGVGLDKMF